VSSGAKLADAAAPPAPAVEAKKGFSGMFFGLLVSFAILWTIYFFLYFFEYGYGGDSYFFMYSYLVRARHSLSPMFPPRGRVPCWRNANRV
jgi:hypothetical protein